jgi:CBS domain-containing protein
MADERIDTVMQTDILRLRPEMARREAVALLVRHESHVAPVIDDTGALIGMLTHKDCFRSALNASYYQQWTGTVSEYMTRNVRALDAETDFVTAGEAFLEHPYRAYPVMRNGQLVGLLTRSDLLATFLSFG